MTYTSHDDKSERIFTHQLGYLILFIILAYILCNVVVIRTYTIQYLLNQENSKCSLAEVFSSHRQVTPVTYGSCPSRDILNLDCSICKIAEVFAPLRQVLPVIYRPAEFLEARGDYERAQLVVAAYSFSWGSFLIFFALICVVVFARVKFLSEHDRRIYVRWCIQHDRELQMNPKVAEQADSGYYLIITFTVFVFIMAFWGYFSFGTHSYTSNMVHERNRDLYWLTIILSFLFLFVYGLIILQIKRYLLMSTDDTEEKLAEIKG